MINSEIMYAGFVITKILRNFHLKEVKLPVLSTCIEIFNVDEYQKSMPQLNRTCFLLTPWSRFILEKLIVTHLIKNFPAFNGTRGSITVFTRAHHLSLS